jgi:hypothetical protein
LESQSSRVGGAEELDVIDDAVVGAGDALPLKGLADGPRVRGQVVDVPGEQFLIVVAHEVEPVAAPGDVALNRVAAALELEIDEHVVSVAVGGHVVDGDRAIGGEVDCDGADGGLDRVPPGADPTEVLERGGEADGPVAAGVEESDIVEEDHAADSGGVLGGHDEGADDGVVAAGAR